MSSEKHRLKTSLQASGKLVVVTLFSDQIIDKAEIPKIIEEYSVQLSSQMKTEKLNERKTTRKR